MNNDLISRSELKNAIDDYVEKRKDVLLWQEDVEEIIDNVPTVEIDTNDIEYKAYCKGLEDGKKIARQHGEWIFNESYKGLLAVCSECKAATLSTHGNFCPNCGAEMRKGGAE